MLRKGEMLMTSMPVFFPRIDDSHCDSNDSSLTGVRCFDNGYVGKQPMASKEYFGEFWLKELQESMNRCTGHRNITEILLKTVLNTIQSIKLKAFSGDKLKLAKMMFLVDKHFLLSHNVFIHYFSF